MLTTCDVIGDVTSDVIANIELFFLATHFPV